VDTKTSLTYHSVGLGYIGTKELRAHCLKDVSATVYADSFVSCQEGGMQTTCRFAKRGWLDKDTGVFNAAFLFKTFNGIKGGEEAVRACLKVEEEEKDDDDDYFYEYEYYEEYDDYDYLEEKDELSRVRRGAGGNKKCINKCDGDQECKRACKNRSVGKGNNKCKKDCKGVKKCEKACKKITTNGNANKETNDRKFSKNKPNDKNKEKINKKLAELGLKQTPPKSTTDALVCLEKKIKQLFRDCGESQLSKP